MTSTPSPNRLPVFIDLVCKGRITEGIALGEDIELSGELVSTPLLLATFYDHLFAAYVLDGDYPSARFAVKRSAVHRVATAEDESIAQGRAALYNGVLRGVWNHNYGAALTAVRRSMMSSSSLLLHRDIMDQLSVAMIQRFVLRVEPLAMTDPATIAKALGDTQADEVVAALSRPSLYRSTSSKLVPEISRFETMSKASFLLAS